MSEGGGGSASKAGLSAALLGMLALLVMIPLAIIPASVSTDCATDTAAVSAGMGVSGDGGATIAGLNPKQVAVARNTYAIGKQRGEPDSVILANLNAQATESSYRNLANTGVAESLKFPHDGEGHDYDSVGPNQLRASIWGAVGMAKLMDPGYQANWFYDQAKTKPGYQTMDPSALAQAVEVSGPNAYAATIALARSVMAAVAKTVDGSNPATAVTDTGTGTGSSTPTDSSGCDSDSGDSGGALGGPFGQRVIEAAKRWIGTPYSWGGGDKNGPTLGVSDGGGAGDANGDTTHKGFDCSGLTLYAVYQASGGKILLPHFTGDHSNPGQLYDGRGKTIPLDQKQPGDLIYFGSGGNTHHVGIYYGKENGKDMLLNAPESGKTVSIMPLSGWNGEDMYVRRFGGDDAAGAPAPNTQAAYALAG
ncbi:C40 family peptidase [Williamsia sterculiae]|uniref:Cell wall-associated hydrolase, NlpC family n=1 Tax=Williamsia sterculiae TaxID=1344003 RepID=A0A1N7HER6_9NOCA|nr:C40 family peptidase [Williamsia sterculiae]SIS23253.1 Cell wall-associated hydrolase, NlpC family [Williamsia sterculiae]